MVRDTLLQMDKKELTEYIESHYNGSNEKIFDEARQISNMHFQHTIYMRGLIEFSNYCQNDCYYCGIRKSNQQAMRYRLTQKEILSCCHHGYALGFRTFVLQSGEDPYFSDEKIVAIINEIANQFPDCAITLSIGERSKESYQAFFDAGARRYLLRHETANPYHYQKLHPNTMLLASRKKCLFQLKEIGFQVGAGMMIGSPYQQFENIAEDLLFLKELQPHMVGIGPFIPHKDTPFKNEKQGDLQFVLFIIALVRILLPTALIPATTALGSIHPKGREQGILAGANVVMPNLSPIAVRKKYSLYNNKICTGDEAAECRVCIENRIKKINYCLSTDRGDHPSFSEYHATIVKK